MRLRSVAWLFAGAFAFLGGLSAFQNFQKPWREYPGTEYNDFPIPGDYQERTEFVFGRLMYPNAAVQPEGYRRRFAVDWRQGGRGVAWTIDYPRSDRHFMLALRRLTRIQARSVEQPLNVEDGDQFDWPWLYAVEVGRWELTDQQCQAVREYLLRGGFLMVDDFHGGREWEIFTRSIKRVFPDRPIVDLENSNPIFHTVYDLDTKYQVPGAVYIRTGLTYERQDGFPAIWRGIYDDHGRVMVAICHNMDLGDSWEHADNPQYPERFSALGIRIGVNYVSYAMTH